jgi:hypothetical protein
MLDSGEARTDAIGRVLMCKMNNVPNIFLEKFLESMKKAPRRSASKL